jgi:hypothetical protein
MTKEPPNNKPLSKVQNRLIEAAARIEEQDDQTLCFQHSVFCQVGLPYRDPGDGVIRWQRDQGNASLLVTAGEARNPETGKWVQMGLPWGAKPRLILSHLNAEALRQQSPIIEIENSLTAFVKRLRGFTGGREVQTLKEQVTRLASSRVSLGFDTGGRAYQVNAQVVTAFDLWLDKDDRQRVFWPTTIRLSSEYFESLQAHAVPLREESVAALAHSAMALDLYAWLAQRLHRIRPEKPQFISWAALKAQFGPGYARMDNFKTFFRKELKQVWTQYRAARLDIDEKGMTLHHSAPPTSRKFPVLPGGKPILTHETE